MSILHIRKIFLLGIVVVTSWGCSSLLQIERQKDFTLKQRKVKHIISINPSFKVLLQTKSKKTRKQNSYTEARKQEQRFNQLLTNNAKKNGITLDVVDTDQLENSDASYFKYLAPLRKEILQVNYLQDFKDINANPTKSNNTETQYQEGPKISTHYSHLAEIYGTPYFAIQGVSYQKKVNESNSENLLSSTKSLLPSITSDEETLFFTVIADVSRSQIVYREYRQVDANATETNLNSIIYDSFKIIAN